MGAFQGFALAIVLVPSAPALKHVSDQSAMQGTWEVTGCSIYGHEMPKEFLTQMIVTVRGDNFQLSPSPTLCFINPGLQVAFGFSPDATGFRFSLDRKAVPKSIDMSRTTMGESTQLQQGIYRLDRERLVICYTTVRDRPKQFQSDETSGAYLFELRRTKR